MLLVRHAASARTFSQPVLLLPQLARLLLILVLVLPLLALVSGFMYLASCKQDANDSSTGSTASRSGSSSASATGASATQNAASEIRFGAAGAGLIGLIIAGLAL